MHGDGGGARFLAWALLWLAPSASLGAQVERAALARGARVESRSRGEASSYLYVDVDDGPRDPRELASAEGAREALAPTLALDAAAPQYLRFDQLARVARSGSRVIGARLLLTPLSPPSPARRLRLVALLRERDAPERAASFDGPLADKVLADGRIELALPALRDDLQRWLDDRHLNLGWRLESDGPLALHSSEALDPRLRPRLELELEAPREDFDPREVLDLGVAFLERLERGAARRGPHAPRIERAEFRGVSVAVQVEPDPRERAAPATGAELRYVAHVRQHGGRVFEGRLRGRWELDGQVIERVESAPLRLGRHQGARFELRWKVDERGVAPERRLAFALEPVAGDVCASNDRLARALLGRGVALRVEERVRDLLAAERNAWGSSSCEDVAQWQLELWNETWLARSRAALAPAGTRERAVLERIDVVPTGALDPLPPHLPRRDADDPPGSGVVAETFDAELAWTWVPSDARDPHAAEGARARALRRATTSADLDFLRALAVEALGLVDLRGADPSPRGFETLAGAKPLGRRFAPLFPSLLGADGASLGPLDPEGAGLLAPVELLALERGLGFRGGPSGHWLHAQPARARLRLIEGTGQPLAGARVDVWQQSAFAFDAEEQVAVELRADALGVLELPLQRTHAPRAQRLPDGYTLPTESAFGRLADDGGNAALLMRVRVEGRADWLRVSALDFALAELAGRGAEPITRRVALPAARVERVPVAHAYLLHGAGRRALPHLVDGRTLVQARWFTLEEGDTLVLDLGAQRRIGACAIAQARNHGAFAAHFRVEVAREDSFAESSELWPVENAPFAEIFARRAVSDPKEPQTRRLHLGGGPLDGRYLRFVAERGGRCDVEEIEVFAAAGR